LPSNVLESAIVPLLCHRVVVALIAATVLCAPAAAAAQTSTIPETGAGVSTTPPVPLAGSSVQTTSAGELPNTGTDPRMLFLTGLALTLLGFGLRLRTADADDY
jgi:LPXTG-motif cell wall-anchored protein